MTVSHRGRPWSRRETELLRTTYTAVPAGRIAAGLGRTLLAVRQKAKVIGVSMSYPERTRRAMEQRLRDLCRSCGDVRPQDWARERMGDVAVSEHSVLRQWARIAASIRAGRLRGFTVRVEAVRGCRSSFCRCVVTADREAPCDVPAVATEAEDQDEPEEAERRAIMAALAVARKKKERAHGA